MTTRKDACRALSVPRATYYAQHRQSPKPARSTPPRRPQPRALSPTERQTILDVLHSERFIDLSPREVYASLLDEGIYLGSVSTFYRILRSHDEVHERRRIATHPAHVKPELVAYGPNQVWSWDITKLHGTEKWTYYHLYVILDVYSRYVVGWLVANRESAELAKRLIDHAVRTQGVRPGTLTLHADRGSSMTSKTVAFLLADLGVTKSRSRPHQSNDNPYSEAQFKTLKYRPDFPERFESLEQARSFLRDFFEWYNKAHRHVGIALMTPETVHYRKTDTVVARRAAVLAAAYAAHPERFVQKPPEPNQPATVAYINQPLASAASQLTTHDLSQTA